jgi:hypothetical protein
MQGKKGILYSIYVTEITLTEHLFGINYCINQSILVLRTYKNKTYDITSTAYTVKKTINIINMLMLHT